MALTLENLRPLLEQFKGDGLVVSCYADRSPMRAITGAWPGPFTGKAAAIRAMLADNPPAREKFEHNFEAVGRALHAPELAHAHGVAVFVARQRDFMQCFALDVPVADELIVHEAPYLVPLLQLMCSQGEFLVILTDTHHARLYAAAPGRVRLLDEIAETVPHRQHSAGECWGTAQATIARQREDRILHYQKDLVSRIEWACAEQPFRGLILLGAHEVLEHLRQHLPPRLAAQVVHEGPQGWTEGTRAIETEIGAIVSRTLQARTEQVAADLRRRFRKGYGVAVGPAAVIEAINQGRLGAKGHGYLVFGPDPHETVVRCTACRSLWTDMPAACPRCQSPCVEANLWEELLLVALRHDLVAYFVKDDSELTRRGGMAAVLAAPLQ